METAPHGAVAMAYEKNPDEIGALWEKEGRKGKYLSGYVEIGALKTNIMCFRVSSDKPNAPKYRILVSRPREDSDAQPDPF